MRSKITIGTFVLITFFSIFAEPPTEQVRHIAQVLDTVYSLGNDEQRTEMQALASHDEHDEKPLLPLIECAYRIVESQHENISDQKLMELTSELDSVAALLTDRAARLPEITGPICLDFITYIPRDVRIARNLVVDGDISAGGNLEVGGFAFIHGDLIVSGSQIFSGGSSNLGDLTLISIPSQNDVCLIYKQNNGVEKGRICSLPAAGVTGLAISVDGGLTQNLLVDNLGNVVTSGSAVVGNNLNVTNNLVVGGTSQFNGTVTINANLNLTGTVTSANFPASSTDNAVVRFDGTTGKILQNSALIATDFSSSTQNNVALKADDGSTANIDLVLVPKGTGALTVAIPDGTATGGDARGNNAVDLQFIRLAATAVASGGASAVIGGENNTASGSDAITLGGISNVASGPRSATLGGSNNTASANRAVVVGGGLNTVSSTESAIIAGLSNTISGVDSVILGGVSNTVTGDYSIAGGTQAQALNSGTFVWADNTFSNYTDNGANTFNVRATNGAFFTDKMSIGGTLTVTGTSTFNNSITVTSGGANITGTLLETGNIIPSADVTYNLGDPTHRWANIYALNLTTSNVINNSGQFVNLLVTGTSQFNGTVTINANLNLTGTVTSANFPASSTDKAVARFNGTTGKILQNSALIATDFSLLTQNNVALKADDGTTANIDLALVPKGTGALTAAIPDGTATGGNARGSYAIDLQLVRAAATQVASGTESTLIGGMNNTASSTFAVVVGGSTNIASSVAAIVAGGENNTASNQDAGVYAGNSSTASGIRSAVLGGLTNAVSGNDSAIIAGENNTSAGAENCIVAGHACTMNANRSVVLGGFLNNVTADYSLAAGTQAQATHAGTFVWADNIFSNYTDNGVNTFNVRATNGAFFTNDVTIGGNLHMTGTIVSANFPASSTDNAVVRFDGTTGKLLQNSALIATDFSSSTQNNVALKADDGTTANIDLVLVPKGTGALTVAIPDGTATGGNARGTNAIDLQKARSGAGQVASGATSALLGGAFNSASGISSVVVGGGTNTASGDASAIAGGGLNSATSTYSAVLGGTTNIASGIAAVVLGGQSNTASGLNSAVIAGTSCTASGDYSLAVGKQAQATTTGSFVWADNNVPNYHDNGTNTFNIRATNGAFFTNNVQFNTAGTALNVVGSQYVSSLKIVAGRIDMTAASGSGSGFTWTKTFIGEADVVFTSAFSSAPIIVSTPSEAPTTNTGKISFTSDVSTSTFKLYVTNQSFVPVNSSVVSFIAMGT